MFELPTIYYLFLFQKKTMRFKAVEMPEVLDHNALLQIHSSIIQKIEEMDRLSCEFKIKQEDHFLRTFMNILQKMGNDLILAQEAYRNIDIEIKRDKYYADLANELNFFKNECFVLRKENLELKKEVKSLRIDDETSKNQIKSLKIAYQKKTKEIGHLKELTLHLKLKLKDANLKEKDNLVSPLKHKEFAQTSIEHQKELFEKTHLAERWLISQHQNRAKGLSVDLSENTNVYVLKREQGKSQRYTPTPSTKFRSTYTSTFRKGSLGKAGRQGESPQLDL